MKKAFLERFCYSRGTFGKLIMPGGQHLATVEPPWFNNLPEISCIPEGVYRCEPSFYKRRGYAAVEVMDVPGRTRVLFHIGNFVEDTLGCILINQRHGARGNEWCGINSARTFRDVFMAQLGNEPFDLTIKMIEAGHVNT